MFEHLVHMISTIINCRVCPARVNPDSMIPVLRYQLHVVLNFNICAPWF